MTDSFAASASIRLASAYSLLHPLAPLPRIARPCAQTDSQILPFPSVPAPSIAHCDRESHHPARNPETKGNRAARRYLISSRSLATSSKKRRNIILRMTTGSTETLRCLHNSAPPPCAQSQSRSPLHPAQHVIAAHSLLQIDRVAE